MPSYRDAYKVPDGVVPDDPPPGDVGNDRDGAKFLMGCAQWTPAREGQAAAVLPAPTFASRQEPDTCTVCGTLVPSGMICAGCLSDPIRDGRLTAEVIKDHARAIDKAEREAKAKGPQSYAARKHRSAAKAARNGQPQPQSDPHARPTSPAGPAEPRPQPGRKRKGGKARPR